MLLVGRLEQALRRINPKLSNDVLHLALKEVQRIQSPGLLANNEAFHRLLTEGVKVSVQQDGSLAPGQPIGNADTRHVEQIHAAGFAAPFHCV